MKNKILPFISLLFFLSFVSSCILGPTVTGNGNVSNVLRNVSSFDKIKVTRGLNVYISQGNQQNLVIEADENLMEYIETDINDNTLNITSTAFIRGSKSLKIYVTITELTEIRASAGSNVNSEDLISCNDLYISGSAGSNIKMQIQADNIDVSASAGSNITLSGTSEESKFKASAGSNIKAENLRANECEAKTSSGANIWTNVLTVFDGHASSGGNIYYYGNPKNTNIEKSSGGNVIQRN